MMLICGDANIKVGRALSAAAAEECIPLAPRGRHGVGNPIDRSENLVLYRTHSLNIRSVE
jgi:hypothetical protein